MSTALLSKAPRRSPFDVNTDGPGPAAYTDPRVMRAKLPGFAPFSSSTRRKSMVSDAKNALPAPGIYELEMDMLSASVAAAGSSFRSKVGRFNEPASAKLDGPGPMAYTLPSTLNAALQPVRRTTRAQTASAGMLAKLNELSVVPNVPSIPRRDQSFGYEPTDAGRLVLQAPAVEGHKGFKEDSVGPGDYDPALTFVAGKQNTKSVFFPNSPRQPAAEDPRRKSFAPGPGTYEHPSVFDGTTGGPSNYKQDYVVRLNEVKVRHRVFFPFVPHAPRPPSHLSLTPCLPTLPSCRHGKRRRSSPKPSGTRSATRSSVASPRGPRNTTCPRPSR
jgi:hypothetical protein